MLSDYLVFMIMVYAILATVCSFIKREFFQQLSVVATIAEVLTLLILIILHVGGF